LKEPGLTGEMQQEYILIIEKSGAHAQYYKWYSRYFKNWSWINGGSYKGIEY
jgi:hypothetical protein